MTLTNMDISTLQNDYMEIPLFKHYNSQIYAYFTIETIEPAQSVKLIIDTGSNLLWLTSLLCEDCDNL